MMKKLALAAALLGGRHGDRTRRQDARHDQAEGPAGLRRQPEPAGLLGGRQPGQLDRPRRRHLQGDRRVHPRATTKKIKWVPLNASQRFTALQSGEIDILSRNTTWTLTRDASLGLEFTGVTYYDGQGFMVTEEVEDHERQAAEGRDRLRAIGNDDREEPVRLLEGEQSRDEAGRLRDAGSDQQGVLLRPLPGLHDGRFGPRVGAQQGSRQSGRPRDPARSHFQGAAGPVRAPRRRRVTSRSSSGSCSR